MSSSHSAIQTLFELINEQQQNPDLDKAQKLLQDPDFVAAVRRTRRSDMLPFLYRIHGKPYSLEDFPQFRSLYDNAFVPQVLYKCGRQIAKSTNLSRFEVTNCLQIPFFQVLYVAPLQSQTMRYSSLYLQEAINTCSVARYLQRPENIQADVGPIIRQIAHQSFGNGAGIQLTYAKTSADRARGIFADQLDCDELQDHLVDNLGVILQSLTQSSWGLKRFTGTAKTLDNTIEFYWQQSSQNEWAVPCQCKAGEAGRYWNIPSLDVTGPSGRNVLDMIQAEGPVCLNCGKPLNVREGEWVPAKPELNSTFAGYHIPQIVVPSIVYDPRKWTELTYKVLHQPLATVYQEILGISSSLGARLISQEDIDKHATLPSVVEMQSREWQRRYTQVVAGIDWGVAEITSFTVLTIIGVLRDGRMHVLWAKRYAGFDTDSLLADIAKTCRFYRVSLVCADFGMGFAQNSMLAHRFGLPVVQVQYSRQAQLMTYRPVLGYPRWVVDKVTALELMYWGIRYDHFFFPPKAESDIYTMDLLSPFEQVQNDRGLETKAFIRNPNLPDDFAHALCFGMLGGLRLVGSTLLNVVPTGAMGADGVDASQPESDNINPKDLIQVQ